MAQKPLVEADIGTGMNAAKALWEDKVLVPKGLLWIYDEDAKEWRFMVATDDVKKRGPDAAYMRIRNILNREGVLDHLPLRRVVAVPTSHPLIKTISRLVATPANELSSASFLQCSFNGIYVDGMHVYYLPSPGKAKKTIAAGSQDTTVSSAIA